MITLMENGHQLKLYLKPISKEEFIQELVQQVDLDVVGRVSSPPMLTTHLFFLGSMDMF